MACIACGLGVNADGKGRVDIDTTGGLKCTGSGGGLTNKAGSGIAIKKDATDGNSLAVGVNGVYVPAAFRMEHYANSIQGTNLTGPNTGTPVTSADVSISITNDTGFAKRYSWQVSCDWGTTDADPGIHAEVAGREGNGDWITPAAMQLPAGMVSSPLIGRVFLASVPANTTKTFKARLRVYRGTITNYSIQVVAWGGYSS